MGMSRRHMCLLLIMSMCVVEEANGISINGGKEVFSSRLNTLQAQRGHFTQTACQWDQGHKSLMCSGRHLTEVPSELPEGAVQFDLQHNDIDVLLNTSFEHYPNLLLLDVRSNRLKTIQSAAFQPLKHLEYLYLSHNNHLVITSSVPFHPLGALVVLEMIACHLQDLPNDLMEWLPNLEHLDLTTNHLSSWNVSRCKAERLVTVTFDDNKFQDLTPDKFMFACPSESISLVANPYRCITEDAIAALPVGELVLGTDFVATAPMLFNLTRGIARSTISTLYISDAELPDGIPNGVFRPLYDHPLELLFLDRCVDLSLFKNVFLGLNSPNLILTAIVMNIIEPEYFAGMPRLLRLVTWDNNLLRFNPHNITWQSKLEYLDMSNNLLSELFGYQFRGLTNLKALNLSRNSRLYQLDFGSCDDLDSLEILNVTGTPLTLLGLSSDLSQFYFAFIISTSVPPAPDLFKPGQTFNNTMKLKLIDVGHSRLNSGNIWDSNLNASLFRGLINLKQLYLSNNPIGNLPDKIFEDNSLLAELMLDNCKIVSLARNTFQGLFSLVHLNLNGNHLLFISTNALQNLAVLETLTINDNTIMFVEEGALENFPLLKNLGMSNNRLVAFNRSTWNTLMKYNLNYIDVSGNPLACQCRYGWLHDFADSSEIFQRHNETLCSEDSLSQMRGKPLLEFDPSKYCVSNIVLLSTLPLVVLASLIGMLLAFYNRWLIRHKLFLVKLAIIGYIEMQDDREHDEFVFDLNIMFTEDDEVWAKEHLRPSLEERIPEFGRYSFGDEDLTLGMHYLEAVHYAVDHSFKTILLLSRRAVRDNWFLIKFRIAMDHVHDELTENTVVIFLEDIPEDEIPYLVRLYLSDRKPYMRWPEDVRGHEYFWNQLTKVVTVNLKYNPMIPPE